MAFGIHLGTLRGYGSSTIGYNTLISLADRFPEETFIAWVPKTWKSKIAAEKANIKTHEVKSGLFWKAATENLMIRSLASRGQIKLLLSLTDTGMPFCSIPHILLVQQSFLAYPPDEWGFKVKPGFLLKIKLMERYFKLGMSTVNLFVVQTKHMAQRLSSRWSIPPTQVSVIPSTINQMNEQIAWTWKAESTPYLCYISNAGPHKNHAILPEMMHCLSSLGYDIRCKLTITREEVPEMVRRANQLGILHLFDFLGSISRGECFSLMAAARVVLMPSKLESFGIPYYEAMSIGCPVVAADRIFAREACGEAALYADPSSGESFALAIIKLLDSGELSKKLGRLGRRRFRSNNWTWNNIASAYIELFDKVM